jgi:hypothetical protein
VDQVIINSLLAYTKYKAKSWQTLYEAIATYVQGKKQHDE